MSTPITEKEQYSFPAFAPDTPHNNHPQNDRRSSDEDGTLHSEAADEFIDHNRLRVTTSYINGDDRLERKRSRSPSIMSPSAQREQSRRLDDDLEMLRAERVVSIAEKNDELGRSKSMARSRSRTNVEPADDFDIDTTPVHEKTKVYQPPANPTTNVSKFFKKVHQSSFLIRYFVYITPLTLLLLIPLLLGLLVFKNTTVGGVRLFWFGIWLEIVWLTLWAARIVAKMFPYPMTLVASLFTNNSKKWRDMGRTLELPLTLFIWWLAIEVSFLPTMKNHHLDGDTSTRPWENTLNKIIVSIFVGACLNLFEKIIIQLIAISFHLRTYADRIEEKIAMEDSEFEIRDSGPASGARTPMAYAIKAQKNARQALNRVGDVAGKVAGDFTGQAVKGSTHPHQVILQLLRSTSGSQVLARRLFRTFAQGDSETVLSDDLRNAFDNDDEANAAFTMFDKDLNGDISMEELESVCVEIGRERKAITASLKDLDSVVSKLDDVFFFIVCVITILVLISLISTSASGVLTSAGSAVLALSWLFSATAQEFLQSVIFVFVKHPFDVGDRVTIYGNTGSQMKGDDYFVKEIALLYTEFKKMEGHVVQAPNSYLNGLFILNQRRSGGLAEAVPVTVKFGTTLEQIDTLRQRLLEFVGSENREYQKNILTELTTIYEAYSITMNVVFFYKSNWQNELLRLQRRNKFICALMVTMTELGIEGPRLGKTPGAAQDYPMFVHGYPNAPPPGYGSNSNNYEQSPGPGPRSGSLSREQPFVAPENSNDSPINRSHPSILRNTHGSMSRPRGETVAQMGKRVDFSLGMSSISSGADFGDVYEDRTPVLPPTIVTTSPSPAPPKSRGSEDSHSLGKTSSRDSNGMARMASNTSSSRTHRNRFFPRKSRLGNADEGTSLDDLERGERDYGREFGVKDMPMIPEASGAASVVDWAEETGRSRRGTVGDESRGFLSGGRIDPRSGIVSPQAVARDSALERGELPKMGGVKRASTGM